MAKTQQFKIGDIVRVPVSYRHGVKARYSGELMEVIHSSGYGTYTLRLVGGDASQTMGSTGGPDYVVETPVN